MKQISTQIRKMQPKDWKQVRTIYNEGLSSGIAAFASKAPNWEEWNASYLNFGRYVATNNDRIILGWVALLAIPDT